MRKWIAVALAVVVVVLLFGVIRHRSMNSLNLPSEVSASWCSGGSGCPQPGNPACNQTPWQESNYAPNGQTASVSSPALGTGCTKHVLNLITAALNDSSEYCFQGLYVEDGGRMIWQTWFDVSGANRSVNSFSQNFPITSFLHNNTDGTQTLVIVGMGPQTSNTAIMTFGSNCAHSYETISVIGHDE